VVEAILVVLPVTVADGVVGSIEIPCERVDLTVGQIKPIGELEPVTGHGYRFTISESEFYGIADVGMLCVLKICSSGQATTGTDLTHLASHFWGFVLVRDRDNDASEGEVRVCELLKDVSVWNRRIDRHEGRERGPVMVEWWDCWPMKFAAGLTRFRLEGPMVVPVATHADFFQRNQSLEPPELVNVCIPFALSRTQPIALNRLVTSLTHNVENGNVLSHITLPKIQTIELAPVHPPRSGFLLSGLVFNFRRKWNGLTRMRRLRKK